MNRYNNFIIFKGNNMFNFDELLNVENIKTGKVMKANLVGFNDTANKVLVLDIYSDSIIDQSEVIINTNDDNNISECHEWKLI
jgi:hypothetical protein